MPTNVEDSVMPWKKRMAYTYDTIGGMQVSAANRRDMEETHLLHVLDCACAVHVMVSSKLPATVINIDSADTRTRTSGRPTISA